MQNFPYRFHINNLICLYTLLLTVALIIISDGGTGEFQHHEKGGDDNEFDGFIAVIVMYIAFPFLLI